MARHKGRQPCSGVARRASTLFVGEWGLAGVDTRALARHTKTSSSTPLPHLLGREKEGIPADLLGLLHTTVEIPQLGLIRSLNVHVSGAIAVYEYTRQRV